MLRLRWSNLRFFQEKRVLQPVPQTDTGSWEEYSKVLELFMAKELGKIDP